MLGLLFNIAVITLASGVGLSLLDVPLPVVNALLAGCLTFIPNIGPFISVLPPALMALSIAPWKAVGVLILYFSIQQLEGTVLTPMVMKKQVSLLPAIRARWLRLSLQSGLASWGLFLALPLVIVSQIWIKEMLVRDILDRWSVAGHPSHSRRLRTARLRRKALR